MAVFGLFLCWAGRGARCSPSVAHATPEAFTTGSLGDNQYAEVGVSGVEGSTAVTEVEPGNVHALEAAEVLEPAKRQGRGSRLFDAFSLVVAMYGILQLAVSYYAYPRWLRTNPGPGKDFYDQAEFNKVLEKYPSTGLLLSVIFIALVASVVNLFVKMAAFVPGFNRRRGAAKVRPGKLQ